MRQLQRTSHRYWTYSKIILGLVVMILQPISAIGWKALDPGTTAHLMDITFVNDSTGWIVGSDGTIIHTTDAGDTWAPQTSGTALDLYGVHFRDFLRGWAVGRNGVVIGTVDGGKTWVEQFQASEGILYDVAFQNENYGWAVGWVHGETDSGTLVRTGNAGKSWSIADGPWECQDVEFLDSQTGWMVGTCGVVYNTIDGGGYWRENTLWPENECWEYYFLHDVYFSNPSHGWIVGDLGTVFHTVDSGRTWIDLSNDDYYAFNVIHFASEKRGILLGGKPSLSTPYPAVMMVTTDGGINWRELSCWSEETGWLTEFTGADHSINYLYAVGWYGTLVRMPLETLAVEEPPVLPTAFNLYQNVPNPFNPSTTIRYELPRAAQVTLTIYDLLGREVATLVDDYIQPGTNEIAWDAGSHPSGIYLARFATPGYSKTIKLVLLK